MRDDQRRGFARCSPRVGLTALLSATIVALGGSLFAGPAQADESVEPGTNVTVASNDCGEVTFTGANSDSTITVTVGGEFGETFDVAYEKSVTFETEVSPLVYVAVTQWGEGLDWIEESSIEVEPCEVEETPVEETPQDEAPEVEMPTVAPDAGR